MASQEMGVGERHLGASPCIKEINLGLIHILAVIKDIVSPRKHDKDAALTITNILCEYRAESPLVARLGRNKYINAGTQNKQRGGEKKSGY